MKKLLLCLTLFCCLFTLNAKEIDTHKLQVAWEKSRQSKATNLNNLILQGKENVPYYSLSLRDGTKLPGERPWHVRWNIIKKCGVNFNNKKILEFGCNMGLLSTHLCREFKPDRVIGFDKDDVIIDCANLVAEAFHVSPTFYNFKLVSGEGAWEDTLGYDNDIVFLLSVFKYFKPATQDAIITFFKESNYPTLIYEDGVKYAEPELQKFQDAGYNRVRKIGMSERNRPMYVVSKA